MYSLLIPFMSWRDDRHQHVRLPAGTEVQRGGAAENVYRAIARLIVFERSHALHGVFHALQLERRAAVIIILAAHPQSETVARRSHYAGRPDLDVELDRRAGLEGP